MAAEPHFTKEQVASALTKAFGIKFAAARLLECSRQTVDNYIQRYPELEQVRQQAKEARIDLFEEKQLKLVAADFWPAIDRGLRGLGKHRGWSEKPQVVIEDNRQQTVLVEKLMVRLGAGSAEDVGLALAGLLPDGDVVEGEFEEVEGEDG